MPAGREKAELHKRRKGLIGFCNHCAKSSRPHDMVLRGEDGLEYTIHWRCYMRREYGCDFGPAPGARWRFRQLHSRLPSYLLMRRGLLS